LANTDNAFLHLLMGLQGTMPRLCYLHLRTRPHNKTK
jgi:hypothetical protein